MFREAIDKSKLMEPRYMGLCYIWLNMRKNEANILERLDRCLCSVNWSQIFSNSTVSHLGFGTSNHKMLLVSTEFGKVMQQSRNHIFKLESYWFKDNERFDLVARC